MTNVFWPVFSRLESVTAQLSHDIHICDEQLDVYSSTIADLLIRAVIEIEAISKALYKKNGGPKDSHIRFDDDAIKYLNQKWKLDQKVVIISHPNCFQSNRTLYSYKKDEKRTDTERMTFSWNNAYQNLKHDREVGFKFGNLRHLFSALAALYILNLYFKDETFDLEKDTGGTSFPVNVGSILFSIELAVIAGHDGTGLPHIPDKFDQAVYFLNWTDDTAKIFQDSINAYQAARNQIILTHPKIIEYIVNNDVTNHEGNLAYNVLGQEEYIRVFQQAQGQVKIESEQLRYEAVVNKHQI